MSEVALSLSKVVRFYLSAFLISLIPSSLLANEVLDYLQAYSGRWVGHFTIHSTANGYSETFPVEQRYWWKDDKLHGLAVSQRDSGMDTASSLTYLDGERLVSEITRGSTKEVYYGLIHDDGLIWLPSNMQRANDYQLKETLVETKSGGRRLITDGFDTYVFSGGLAHVIYKGELTLQVEVQE